MKKLNEVLAVESGLKTRVKDRITQAHRASEKSVLMNGFRKVYQPKDEDGETYPPESQKVQYNYRGVLNSVSGNMVELFDVTAQKDWANCIAHADVIVDGKTLIKDAPATYLLFLEKKLDDMRTLVTKMSELDPSEDWKWDENRSLHVTSAITTQRTKKAQRPIVLYQATDKHPAQTQLITEDIVVGHWSTIKESGAIPRPKKAVILARIEKLSNAVKVARSQANAAAAESKDIGKGVFDFIFAGGE